MFYSCADQRNKEDRYAHISDIKARTIIADAIDFAGRLDKWESIQQLSYTKYFRLLREDGSVEKTYQQMHNYDFENDEIWVLSIENSDTKR